MLTHPTLERLIALGLTGMAKAFDDQRRQPDVAALPFEDRLAIMVDREVVERQNKCLATRLKFAGLRHLAVVEDIDLATPRGLDRTLFTSLVAGDWIERKLNLLIIGPTGVGGSPARSATRPAVTIAPSSITGCRGCSRRSHSPAATVATDACWPASPASTCSSSTIGGSPR